VKHLQVVFHEYVKKDIAERGDFAYMGFLKYLEKGNGFLVNTSFYKLL
jgi:hypothetical protein